MKSGSAKTRREAMVICSTLLDLVSNGSGKRSSESWCHHIVQTDVRCKSSFMPSRVKDSSLFGIAIHPQRCADMDNRTNLLTFACIHRPNFFTIPRPGHNSRSSTGLEDRSIDAFHNHGANFAPIW